MNRWTVRSTIATVAVLAALLAICAASAAAFEPARGGWYWQNPVVQGDSLHDVAVTSGRAVAVGDAGSIYASVDGGRTWNRQIAQSDPDTILWGVDFVNSLTGWAAGQVSASSSTGVQVDAATVLATTNGGADWHRQSLPGSVPGSGSFVATDVSFANANDGWVCGSWVDTIGANRATRIWRTTDGGATWTVAKEWHDTGIAQGDVQLLSKIKFVDANTGWATGWGRDASLPAADQWGYVVLKTTDGGATWTITRFGVDGRAKITALAMTSTTDGYLATDFVANYVPATIWKTTDGGATWTAQTTRAGSTITGLAANAAGQVYATGRTEGLSDWQGFTLHSTDGGAIWSQEYTQTTITPEAVDFDPTTPALAIAVGDGGLFLRRDSGSGAWSQPAPNVRANLTNVQFWNADLGWAVGWKSTILRTTDGGHTWKSMSVPANVSLQGIDMISKTRGWAVGCSGPHVPYLDQDAGYGTIILRTTDGGRHWKYQVQRGTSPGLAGVDFVDKNHGWVVGTSGLVMRTTDGGRTWWKWTVGSGADTGDTLRDVKFTDTLNGVAVGGEAGAIYSRGAIYSTIDGGLSWIKAPTDAAPTAPLRAIQVQKTTAGAKVLWVIGDRGQIYTATAPAGPWALASMGLPVQEDPPFYHLTDIGMYDFPGSYPSSLIDAQNWALGENGAIFSDYPVPPPSGQVVWTDETQPSIRPGTLLPSFIDNHTGGSGQSNQLNGLAVVNWLNAWAVGDNGTILSFDRLSPDTAFAPSNGWLRTPVLTLTPKDQKSGVAGVRWVVDPRDSFGNIVSQLNPWVWNFDWSSWPWQYGPTASFDPAGEPPGAKHVIYYQSVDNVGNLELDPFWLNFADDFTTIPRYAEVPKHVIVTLDTIGPQTYAPQPVVVERTDSPAFLFWVNDNLSPKAKVTIRIRNGASDVVKTLSLGWLATSHEFNSAISGWQCNLRVGNYTFSVYAVDQAGNDQAVLGGNTFKVKP